MIRTLETNRDKCRCTSHVYHAFTDWLTLPRPLVHGAEMSGCPDNCGCDGCSPWKLPTRRKVTKDLQRAVTALEDATGLCLCPAEKTMLIEEDSCPVDLCSPVDYIGKKEVITADIYPVCYTDLVGCEPNADCCNTKVGQVVIDDIPDTWDGDMSLVNVSYTDSCRTPLCLHQPDWERGCCQLTDEVPCPMDCECPVICDILSCEVVHPELDPITYPDYEYCQAIEIEIASGECAFAVDDRVQIWSLDRLVRTFDFGTVIMVDAQVDFTTYTIGFTEPDTIDCADTFGISEPHLIATYLKYELVSPTRDSARVCNSNCTQEKEDLKDFVGEVKVTFSEIVPDFEIVEICDCSSCKVCHCRRCDDEETDPCDDNTPQFEDFYEWTVDKDTGEFCFSRKLNSGCTCLKKHRIKFTYGTDPQMSDTIEMAIFLRALLWSNQNIRCGCDDFDRVIENWLGMEEGVQFDNFGKYPYGRTRAGFQLKLIMDGIEKQQERDGRRDPKSGFMSAKKLESIHGSGTPYRKRSVNPRGNR